MKKRRILLHLLPLLCVLVLLFTSCESGALFLINHVFPTTETTDSTNSTLFNQLPSAKSSASTDRGQVDDSTLLDSVVKAQSNPSLEGSAGESPLSISSVVRMVQDSVVQIYTAAGSGSGVIISAQNGWIITCNHVIDGATAYTVELSNSKTYSAQLIGTDSDSDLAILKITPGEGETLTAATLGVSDDLVVGESVVVIGNPLGTLGGTVSQGIVSAKERQISFQNNDGSTTVMNLIQTDAAINSGNSGGAMFNRKGQLVGVVNAKYASSGVEGLGFAIPIDRAYEVMKELIRYGYVRGIPDDGLTLQDQYVTSNYSFRIYGNSYYTVLYVSASQYNSELNRCVIVSVNGTTVSSASEYKAAIANCKVGDVLTIEYKTVDRWGNISNSISTTTLELREKVPSGITPATD